MKVKTFTVSVHVGSLAVELSGEGTEQEAIELAKRTLLALVDRPKPGLAEPEHAVVDPIAGDVP